MTTLELAERLSRRLKGGAFTRLPMAAAMDVVEAVNAGLQECYERLPEWQRRTTLSLDLPAPVPVSLVVTSGSVDITGASPALTDAQIGRSIVVDGDSSWNEVQTTAKLLDPYLGATGTRAAVVYGDSTYNALANLDGFASAPRLAESREVLSLFNARTAGYAAELGTPRHYWFEPAARSLGATPGVYLRVFPAPSRAMVLRIDVEFRPVVITYAALNQASAIPLADQLLHNALIPLCVERLMHSPEWNPAVNGDVVRADALAARRLLLGQRPHPGVPANRVFTPPGY